MPNSLKMHYLLQYFLDPSLELWFRLYDIYILECENKLMTYDTTLKMMLNETISFHFHPISC